MPLAPAGLLSGVPVTTANRLCRRPSTAPSAENLNCARNWSSTMPVALSTVPCRIKRQT